MGSKSAWLGEAILMTMPSRKVSLSTLNMKKFREYGTYQDGQQRPFHFIEEVYN